MYSKCKDCGRQSSTAYCTSCQHRRRNSIVPTKEVFDRFVETFELIRDDGQHIPNMDGERVFCNSLYQVNMRDITGGADVKCIHLSIKRLDKAARRDWRHFQWIKNELLGDEWCGIEVYPPESHLVDTSNQYHMWCFESDEHFGFMWKERLVSECSTNGAVQRKWPDDKRPTDLVPAEELDVMLVKFHEETQ
jgi:hypothetical protein